ncbi:MAG: citrate/2-methylcitrate synthase [Treponema sp.]|jgi:citrate synthase|nr:citrate/2-methylcitrate synthase [Treponema sp.]
MEGTKEFIPSMWGGDYIDSELYTKFNVKRGLRNPDGTGVLVGLTRIGDVHGYIIDEGEKVPVEGKLCYRGIDIEQIVTAALAERRFCFEETVYLLLFGSLPNREQLGKFSACLGKNRALPRNFAEDAIVKIPSKDIMNKMAAAVLTLYAYDPDPENRSPENVLRQCVELISRFPTIAAYSYRAKKHYFDKESLILHMPEPTDSTAETILSLIRPDKGFTRLEAELLDISLALHAEHGGGNNSTFAVHLVSSSDTDTYSAVAAAIGALKGAKHGGASAKVMSMIADIKQHISSWDSEDEVADYLARILRGEVFDGTGLVYGQGHAVYTKSDPRARILRDRAAALAEEKGLVDEFNLYTLIEHLMPEVFRKVKGSKKDICANVDFYSGFVFKMMDIPEELYTPLFAVSRIAGWCAHRIEELIAGGRIIRPAYKCVQPRIPYTPLVAR